MDAIEPFVAHAACRRRRAGRASRSSARRSRTPALRRSHSHSPSLAPSAASASRSWLRLSACFERVCSVTSCHSSITSSTPGRIFTCSDRAPDDDVSTRSAIACGLRLFRASCTAPGSEVWLNAGNAPHSERPRACSAGQPTIRASASFHSVTCPALLTIDIGEIEGGNRAAAAVVYVEPPGVGAVCVIGEIQRHRGDRHDVPRAMVDDFDERRWRCRRSSRRSSRLPASSRATNG